MPLPIESGLITSFCKPVRDVTALWIQRILQSIDAVMVAVLSGENRCATRRADGISHVTALENHPGFGDAVDIGSVGKASRGEMTRPVSGNRRRGMVIREHEDDVGLFG